MAGRLPSVPFIQSEERIKEIEKENETYARKWVGRVVLMLAC